jgi:hypothetical protein
MFVENQVSSRKISRRAEALAMTAGQSVRASRMSGRCCSAAWTDFF